MTLHEAKTIGGCIKRVLATVESRTLLPVSILHTPPHWFDFSATNRDVESINMAERGALQKYILRILKNAGKTWGWGGYGEDRNFYRSPLFESNGEPRTVHLGIDIWLPQDTPVYLPIAGTVHSFQNNQNFLDYGPTIIIEHEISDARFYTLYGHLNTDSLQRLTVGSAIPAGGEVGRVGKEFENGSWAPHLHFQIIGDMLGKSGDFPGVARQSEKDFYLALCPNSELLFQI